MNLKILLRKFKYLLVVFQRSTSLKDYEFDPTIFSYIWLWFLFYSKKYLGQTIFVLVK